MRCAAIAGPVWAVRVRRQPRAATRRSSDESAAGRRAGWTAASEFPGRGPAADLDRSYAVADLLVLASRAETYGMVVTEALARGLPVLATRSAGEPRRSDTALTGSGRGLLVSPGDPAALGAALRAWLGDAELRARWRAAP